MSRSRWMIPICEVMSAAGVVFSLWLMSISIDHLYGYSAWGYDIGVTQGCVFARWLFIPVSGEASESTSYTTQSRLRWWPVYWTNSFVSEALLPLWIPAGVVFMVFCALIYVGARGRARAGRCGQCGYDLRGSAERCPECGCATLPRLSPTFLNTLDR